MVCDDDNFNLMFGIKMNKVIHYISWGGFEICKFQGGKVVFNNKSSYDDELKRITCPECLKKISWKDDVD